jgi:predicted nucleic acid-binding Zn ribbon protein
MAAIVTIAQNHNEALVATAFSSHHCAFCQAPIAPGERWVREKIFEPFLTGEARYRRYHADLFGEAALSCWEKHQLEHETAQAAVRAA